MRVTNFPQKRQGLGLFFFYLALVHDCHHGIIAIMMTSQWDHRAMVDRSDFERSCGDDVDGNLDGNFSFFLCSRALFLLVGPFVKIYGPRNMTTCERHTSSLGIESIPNLTE